MEEVPAALPWLLPKNQALEAKCQLSPSDTPSCFLGPVNFPLGSAMALLQLLEGWAGSAILAGTHGSYPWKHGKAQRAVRAAN